MDASKANPVQASTRSYRSSLTTSSARENEKVTVKPSPSRSIRLTSPSRIAFADFSW